MTEKCPTSGFTCVDQVMARVQACVDQARGFMELVQGGVYSAGFEHLFKHYGKLADLLEEAVDTYTESHGQPDVMTDLEAVRWVLSGLKA